MATQAAAWAAMVFVGLSGVAKLIDLSEFREVVRTWSTVPRPLVWLIVPAVPAVEVGLFLFWLLNVHRVFFAFISAVMLGLFTLAMLVENTWGTAVTCGCFGAVRAEFIRGSGLATGAIVNCVLIAMIVLFLVSKPRTLSVARPSASIGARGFTLVETLVCVAVVAVVVGLSLWGLAAARERGRVVVTLSRLQQHSATMATYTTDYRGVLPYFASPSGEQTSLASSDLSAPVLVRYFESFRAWNIALGDGYYGGRASGAVFRSPFAAASETGDTGATAANDFFYPCVFLAAADYWHEESRRLPPEQLKSTRLSSVRFADKKTLVVHDHTAGASGRRVLAAAMVGGHAVELQGTDVRNESLNDGLQPWISDFGGHIVPRERLLHTRRGVNGRDLH